MKTSRMIMLLCIFVLLSACVTGCAGRDGAAGDGNGIAGGGNGVSGDGQAGSIGETGGSGQGEGGTAVSIARGKEWAYVPEVIVLGDGRADYGGMRLNGDTLCYLSMPQSEEDSTRNVCRYSLNDKTFISEPIRWQVDGAVWELSSYAFGREFDLWIIANVYPADYSHLRRFLCRFDAEGNTVFSREVTEQLGSGIAIGGIAIDGQERIYVYTNEYTDEAGIWLYEADGSFHGRVSFENDVISSASGISPSEIIRVKGVVSKGDGGFYFCIGKGEDPDHCRLAEVDFENGRLTEVIEEFPNVNGLCVDTAGQYDFLIYDNLALYGYRLSAQKRGSAPVTEELFVWEDSDVNGYYVTSLGVAEDGRYYCMVEDWEHDDRCVVFLRKTKAEDAPRRVNMTIAAVNSGSDLAAMAVKFNRGSSQYHLTVRDFNSLTELYNAILVREAIDIIDLSGLDVRKLVRQGVLEDLGPYLEQSEKFDRSDFLEGVLEAYTFDGILTGIPETFTMQTLVGDSRMLGKGRMPGGGTVPGLTLEGLLEAARRNPEALPFDRLYGNPMDREEAMQYIMMFNEEAFVDWDTGECHFDSDTFQEVLELVGRMPDSKERDRIKNGEGEASLPTRLQSGEVLFAVADMYSLKDFLIYEAIFGETAACVGFPAPDGIGGTLLNAQNAFGIVAVSANKSGAWEFLESIPERKVKEDMESDEITRLYWFPDSLPSLKRILDIIAEYTIEEELEWAAKGHSFHGQRFEDGWTYERQAVTREEIDVVLGLPKGAMPSFSVEGDEIIKIINEEAPAYYSGQKRVEDVTAIIQNRVRLYVNENR